MNREYQIVIDFQMDDYDAQQDGDRLTDTLRRIVESYTDNPEKVHTRFVQGAPVLEPFHCKLCGQHITDGKPCGCGARHVG